MHRFFFVCVRVCAWPCVFDCVYIRASEGRACVQMIATLRQGVVRAREQLVQKEAEITQANARLAEVSRQI